MTQYSDATLLSWLATKPDKLEKHLDQHPEDIERLERLTALDVDQVAAMEHTVSAPDDFAERVISRISVDPKLREAGSVFADLFTLGFRTMRVVLGSADDESDEHEPDQQQTDQQQTDQQQTDRRRADGHQKGTNG